eukprot:106293-Chlamydomonas_euryale.AAC.1
MPITLTTPTVLHDRHTCVAPRRYSSTMAWSAARRCPLAGRSASTSAGGGMKVWTSCATWWRVTARRACHWTPSGQTLTCTTK